MMMGHAAGRKVLLGLHQQLRLEQVVSLQAETGSDKCNAYISFSTFD